MTRHSSTPQRKRKTKRKAAPWKPEPPCPYDLNNAPGWRLGNGR